MSNVISNAYGYSVEEESIKHISDGLRILAFPIDKLKLDPHNARNHGARSISAITDSLKAFGQQTPIVFDSDFIVRKGNGTLEAAKSLGWKYIAATPTNLKDSNVSAWAIADNRTSELSNWDQDVLRECIDKFSSDKGLLDSVGFTADELNGILKIEEPKETLTEEIEKLRPIQRCHVLITVVGDKAMSVLPKLEQLALEYGIELIQSEN